MAQIPSMRRSDPGSVPLSAKSSKARPVTRTGSVFPGTTKSRALRSVAATSCAIEPFPGQAGTAGAVLGGMQNLGAGVVTLLAASFPMTGQVTLGAIMTVMVLIVALTLAPALAPLFVGQDRPMPMSLSFFLIIFLFLDALIDTMPIINLLFICLLLL